MAGLDSWLTVAAVTGPALLVWRGYSTCCHLGWIPNTQLFSIKLNYSHSKQTNQNHRTACLSLNGSDWQKLVTKVLLRKGADILGPRSPSLLNYQPLSCFFQACWSPAGTLRWFRSVAQMNSSHWLSPCEIFLTVLRISGLAWSQSTELITKLWRGGLKSNFCKAR